MGLLTKTDNLHFSASQQLRLGTFHVGGRRRALVSNSSRMMMMMPRLLLFFPHTVFQWFILSFLFYVSRERECAELGFRRWRLRLRRADRLKLKSIWMEEDDDDDDEEEEDKRDFREGRN